MIRLGLDASAKVDTVRRVAEGRSIRKIVAISPARFRQDLPDVGAPVEHVEWAEVIQYKYFYRLVQEIDGSTLVILNECLRTQNRHDLTYNCIRHFLNQTQSQIVFQRLPIINSLDDFMALVDFDTRSRWKRERFRPEMLSELDIRIEPHSITLEALSVEIDAKTRDAYQREKRKLIDSIGNRDPHTIPRTLHLIGGKAKAAHVGAGALVGRNNHLKLQSLETYREVATTGARTVFEFCHDVGEFSDFLAVTGQSRIQALVADLPVDRWYFERFTSWAKRVGDAYAALYG